MNGKSDSTVPTGSGSPIHQQERCSAETGSFPYDCQCELAKGHWGFHRYEDVDVVLLWSYKHPGAFRYKE